MKIQLSWLIPAIIAIILYFILPRPIGVKQKLRICSVLFFSSYFGAEYFHLTNITVSKILHGFLNLAWLFLGLVFMGLSPHKTRMRYKLVRAVNFAEHKKPGFESFLERGKHPLKNYSKLANKLNDDLREDLDLFESDPKDQKKKKELLERVEEFHSFCLYHCFFKRFEYIGLLFIMVLLKEKSSIGFLIKLDPLVPLFIFLNSSVDDFTLSAIHFRSSHFLGRGRKPIYMTALHYTYYRILRSSFRWFIIKYF